MELEAKILSAIGPTNRISWGDLMVNLNERERRSALNTVRDMEKRGLVQRRIEAGSLYVDRVAGSAGAGVVR